MPVMLSYPTSSSKPSVRSPIAGGQSPSVLQPPAASPSSPAEHQERHELRRRIVRGLLVDVVHGRWRGKEHDVQVLLLLRRRHQHRKDRRGARDPRGKGGWNVDRMWIDEWIDWLINWLIDWFYADGWINEWLVCQVNWCLNYQHWINYTLCGLKYISFEW